MEQEGTLWIAYDASMDAGTGAGSCLAGCTEGGESFWAWMADGNTFGAEAGWVERSDGNVLLSVTVRHN